jgi:hypothetical protein
VHEASQDQLKLDSLQMMVVSTVCLAGALIALAMLKNGRLRESPLCPTLAVITWTSVIMIPIMIRAEESLPMRLGLGWIVLESFLIWITLPCQFHVACALSFGVGAFHTIMMLWKGQGQQLLMRQVRTILSF